MSTQLIFGIAGAAIGFAVTGGNPLGAQIGFALGGLVGSLIDPTVSKGPALNDRKLQTSEYGTPLPYVWGLFRVSGVNDWQRDDGKMVESGGGGGGKGGGGGSEQPTYTHSWSLKYCRSTIRGETAIVGIDKHWCDGRVVNEDDINPTVYIGWVLQLPDESIEADLGVGQVPANRWMGSEVYNEVQMDQFFNRLPNMEALIRTVGEQNGPITQLAVGVAGTTFPRYPALLGGWPIDWPASFPEPTLLDSYPFEYYVYASIAWRMAHCGYSYVNIGGILGVLPLYQAFVSSGAYPAIGEADVFPGLAIKTDDGAGNIGWMDFAFNAGIEVGRYVYSWATTEDKHTVIIITVDDWLAGSEFQWHKLYDGALVTEGPVAAAGNSIGTTPIHLGSGNFGDNIFHTNKSIVEPNGIYIWTFRTGGAFVDNPNPLLDNESVALFYIDSADNTLKQYTAATGIGVLDSYGGPSLSGAQSGLIYCPGNGYCATILGQSTQYALYTRLAGFGVITLAIVVRDILKLTGSEWDLSSLQDDEFDVSQGESTIIHGTAMVSQMQKRNFIEMLRSAYDFDLIESDDGEQGILKLVMHDGDPDEVLEEIPDEDLGYGAEGEDARPLIYLVKHMQDAELPGRVVVKYYDQDYDYLIGSQSAQLRNISVDNEVSLDLSIAMTAGEARAIAKKRLTKAWLERDTYGFTTSWKYAHLEPGDRRIVHGISLRFIKKIEKPYGIIEWEGVPSVPYVADQPDDEGAPSEGATPPPPPSPRGATTVEFFDVAMVTDDDLDVGFRVAACATDLSSTWTGCTIQKSVDGGTTWNTIGTLTIPSTMGTVEWPLGNFTGGNVFDYQNTLRVVLRNGTPESVTELAVLNGANAAIYGREIIAFTTATQVDATTWDLSGLLRGRRGTEWAMGTHGDDEPFALAATCLNLPTPAAEVGQARLYKAITFGTSAATTAEESFTNTAQSARCYAPVHLAGGVTAADAVLLEAVARTRKGGEWRDGVDITQADAPAEFVLEIWNATYTLCARVVSGLSTPNYSYSSADQTTEFGAEQSIYYFTFAQVGQFGLGIRARGSCPGPGSVVNDPVSPIDPYNPPVDPPTGGGAIDHEMNYPTDNINTSGKKIGDITVCHFETTTAPVSGSLSTACVATAYGMRLRLCTDLAGTVVVAEAYGPVVASLQLGTEYAWSIPLLPTTDYYVYVTHELSPGNPSGTPGTAADVAVTLNVEL